MYYVDNSCDDRLQGSAYTEHHPEFGDITWACLDMLYDWTSI